MVNNYIYIYIYILYIYIVTVVGDGSVDCKVEIKISRHAVKLAVKG